ncbi:helix-turn-helix domain-containing protein [Streptomyces sp. NPDC005227]|uniref:helix-turn-helix domain-containing protein n=1 Tax=Streptomyces sp. NPDC005227 TaxID=3364707 RepID=UPI0036CAC739
MDTQNLSAPSCVQPLIPRGVTHINVRHTTRYTVIGNHLAQHRALSLTAIGLAVHIQSLPAGARVDIKSLAGRFPEGETRIASSLRELEAHGYLSRTRERLPSGRVVTHTVSHNQPRDPSRRHPGKVVPQGRCTNHLPEHRSSPAPRLARPTDSPPATAPPPPVAPRARPPAPVEDPPKPPLPSPVALGPDDFRVATGVLAGLHRHDPRLLLAERDVRRLAPAIAAWLERGVAPEAVSHTLTTGLPAEPLRHPAALLAHRLTELLPQRTPAAPRLAPRAPLQNCDGCDRAFRAAEPGHCRDCRRRTDLLGAAQHERDDPCPRADTRSARHEHRP